MPQGSVFLGCATMSPDNVRRLSRQVEQGGIHYLDAPISGGSARAEQGN